MREQREKPSGKSTARPGKAQAGRGAGGREHGITPGPMSPEMALALQRVVGNGAVSRLIDAEEEAAAPAVQEVLRSPGRPLHEDPRSEMEARLGADFSEVRLHTGPAAERSAGVSSLGTDAPVQRYHNPNITNDNKNAALDYLKGDGRAVANSFREQNRLKINRGSIEEAMVRFKGVFPGEIDQVNRLVVGYYKSGVASVDGKSPEQIGLLVRAVNAMEENIKTKAAAKVESGDIPLGTEFTFVRSDIVKLDPSNIDGKKASAAQKTAYRVAKGLIDQWKGRVQAVRKDTVRVRMTGGKAGINAAAKFTYSEVSGGEWYWVLDIDAACLETQTMKTSSVALQEHGSGLNVKDIIKDDIFAVARELKLAPSRRLASTSDPKTGEDLAGGGGHISIDAAKAFGGSVTILIDLLERLQTDAETWQHRFETSYDMDGSSEKANDPNSPWMKDLTLNGPERMKALESYLDELQEIRSDAQGGRLDFAGALSRLTAFNRLLTENFPVPPKDSQGKDLQGAALDKHLMHYQAINIEHAGNPDESARLELRDIPAQDSFDRLLADVSRILIYIDNVKSEYKDYTN